MMRHVLSVFVIGLVLAGPAWAETKTFELQVSAGDTDCNQVPAKVLLWLPGSLAKAQSVALQGPDGKKLPAQLTRPSLLTMVKPRDAGVARELHFILPHLPAGKSTMLKAAVSTDSPSKGKGYSWHDTPGKYTELHFGARPVLRYMYQALDPANREATYKVYHHLYDPAGKRLVTKGPGGRYTHHRGLYYGFNKITYGNGKKADIWHCRNAHQAQEKFLAGETGPVLGRHRLLIGWYGQEKEPFAVEEREMTVYNVSGGQLVEFASRLKTKGGPIKLDGDPQHAGFQFRADNEVAAKTAKQTYYLRPGLSGKPGGIGKPGQTQQNGNYPWKGMSFVLGGQRFTAGYLDKPTNPKPAFYSERDYGRFGSYFVYELTEKKPLDINYRVWLQEGEMKLPQLAAKGADFVKPPKVVVK